MAEKTLATFRIEIEKWNAFKEKAAADNTNATALIQQWISLYLNDDLNSGIDINVDRIDNNLDNALSRLDDRIDSAIAPLQQQIDQLKAELGEFAA